MSDLCRKCLKPIKNRTDGRVQVCKLCRDKINMKLFPNSTTEVCRKCGSDRIAKETFYEEYCRKLISVEEPVCLDCYSKDTTFITTKEKDGENDYSKHER